MNTSNNVRLGANEQQSMSISRGVGALTYIVLGDRYKREHVVEVLRSGIPGLAGCVS